MAILGQIAAALDGIRVHVTTSGDSPETARFLEDCISRKYSVALGHSNIEFEVAVDLVKQGIRSVTHALNCLPLGHQRRPQAGLAALMCAEIELVEVIPTPGFLHPAMLRLLYLTAGPERIALVSDCVADCDCSYVTDGRGACVNSDGRLFGSVLPLAQSLVHFARATGCSPVELCRMSSLNSARFLGLPEGFGTFGAQSPLCYVEVDFGRGLVRPLTFPEGDGCTSSPLIH